MISSQPGDAVVKRGRSSDGRDEDTRNENENNRRRLNTRGCSAIPMPAPANTTASTATAESAPVLEFRCLFSRDGHKKRKTFHDGTLKFHAFNARVMVYDLDRHYVGDLHYRNDDAFAEGLELRLDSGVVVQVQDLLGQTLTPLDQVLCSKNKKATTGDNVTTSTSTHAVTSGSSRVGAAAGGGAATVTRKALRPIPAVSHQRPRSLKDVLAVSQPPSSRPRARLLTLDRQRPPSDQPPRKKLKPTVAVVSKPAEDTVTSLPFQDVVDLHETDTRSTAATATAGKSHETDTFSVAATTTASSKAAGAHAQSPIMPAATEGTP
ncbi:hypothetical protein DV738_g3820, partial [Chaetothyriales sp. CBS 135597]